MEFIFTEPSGEPGEQSELPIWNNVKKAFANREGIAYWRYPLFTDDKKGGRGTKRKYKEPDILIVDRELGLVLIEVKGCRLEQVEQINGPLWHMSADFYERTITPVRQVNRHAQDLLRYCNREDELTECITYRLLIGLPKINRNQWTDKFGRLPSVPSVVCKGEAGSQLLLHISDTAPIVQRKRLSDNQWRVLMGVIAGHVSKDDASPCMDESFSITEPSEISIITQRINIVDRIENRLFELDLQQERIGKQIPPGPQRIRGIAGSGKTIVLCQRAAHLFLKHPDWDIALIFSPASSMSKCELKSIGGCGVFLATK